MLFSTTLAVFGLVAGTHAHIVMNTPVPFQLGNNPQAPLSRDFSDFPCKTPGNYVARGPATNMTLGSSQPLSFTGSAVHGGGSCQISITYDKNPTKDSVFKVIHSIQGGCPMRNIDGNNGNDASLVSPSMYSFTIPNELPTGEATLAWTWFNKIGNREMYMNCAPIAITNGNTRRDVSGLETRTTTQLAERDLAFYNGLPNMYIMNLGTCETEQTTNLIFPNPGTSLEKNADVRPFVAAPDTPACNALNAASNNVAPAPSAPASAPSSTAAAPSSPKATLPGGVFIEPSVAPSKPVTSAPAATTPVANPPAQTPAPIQATTFTVVPTKASAIAPPAATGNSGALSGPCSTEGEWNCIGSNSFQQCGSGTWSVVQSLAAGTKCTPGQSNAIDIQAIGAKKRDLRFSGAHLRRHLHKSF